MELDTRASKISSDADRELHQADVFPVPREPKLAATYCVQSHLGPPCPGVYPTTGRPSPDRL